MRDEDYTNERTDDGTLAAIVIGPSGYYAAA